MMGERDLEVELKEKDEIIMSLRLNEHLLKDKLEISRRNMGKQLERIKELFDRNKKLEEDIDNEKNDYRELFSNYIYLQEENEQLKKEYKIAIDEMVTDYKKLEKENEMLRILLKDIYVDDELRKLAERYGVENE